MFVTISTRGFLREATDPVAEGPGAIGAGHARLWTASPGGAPASTAAARTARTARTAHSTSQQPAHVKRQAVGTGGTAIPVGGGHFGRSKEQPGVQPPAHSGPAPAGPPSRLREAAASSRTERLRNAAQQLRQGEGAQDAVGHSNEHPAPPPKAQALPLSHTGELPPATSHVAPASPVADDDLDELVDDTGLSLLSMASAGPCSTASMHKQGVRLRQWQQELWQQGKRDSLSASPAPGGSIACQGVLSRGQQLVLDGQDDAGMANPEAGGVVTSPLYVLPPVAFNSRVSTAVQTDHRCQTSQWAQASVVQHGLASMEQPLSLQSFSPARHAGRVATAPDDPSVEATLSFGSCWQGSGSMRRAAAPLVLTRAPLKSPVRGAERVPAAAFAASRCTSMPVGGWQERQKLQQQHLQQHHLQQQKGQPAIGRHVSLAASRSENQHIDKHRMTAASQTFASPEYMLGLQQPTHSPLLPRELKLARVAPVAPQAACSAQYTSLIAPARAAVPSPAKVQLTEAAGGADILEAWRKRRHLSQLPDMYSRYLTLQGPRSHAGREQQAQMPPPQQQQQQRQQQWQPQAPRADPAELSPSHEASRRASSAAAGIHSTLAGSCQLPCAAGGGGTRPAMADPGPSTRGTAMHGDILDRWRERRRMIQEGQQPPPRQQQQQCQLGGSPCAADFDYSSVLLLKLPRGLDRLNAAGGSSARSAPCHAPDLGALPPPECCATRTEPVVTVPAARTATVKHLFANGASPPPLAVVQEAAAARPVPTGAGAGNGPGYQQPSRPASASRGGVFSPVQQCSSGGSCSGDSSSGRATPQDGSVTDRAPGTTPASPLADPTVSALLDGVIGRMLFGGASPARSLQTSWPASAGVPAAGDRLLAASGWLPPGEDGVEVEGGQEGLPLSQAGPPAIPGAAAKAHTPTAAAGAADGEEAGAGELHHQGWKGRMVAAAREVLRETALMDLITLPEPVAELAAEKQHQQQQEIVAPAVTAANEGMVQEPQTPKQPLLDGAGSPPPAKLPEQQPPMAAAAAAAGAGEAAAG